MLWWKLIKYGGICEFTDKDYNISCNAVGFAEQYAWRMTVRTSFPKYFLDDSSHPSQNSLQGASNKETIFCMKSFGV